MQPFWSKFTDKTKFGLIGVCSNGLIRLLKTGKINISVPNTKINLCLLLFSGGNLPQKFSAEMDLRKTGHSFSNRSFSH
jgi:hypothetical protein